MFQLNRISPSGLEKVASRIPVSCGAVPPDLWKVLRSADAFSVKVLMIESFQFG